MWIFLYISLGIAALGLFTKKGKNVVKFIQILYETVQNNAKNPKVNPEFELINLSPVIKYGDIHLNGTNTFFHYDVLCFTSNAFSDREIHNHNPTHEICERLPVNLIRSGACLASIPFRPSDFNHKKVYLAIKRISNENYSIYCFENSEYVNILDTISRFERDLIVNSQKETFLAEAYD